MLNPCVTVKFGRISGVTNIDANFMQICRLFKVSNVWNFWRTTCLSATNHRWVINAQTGPVFWPTLYIMSHVTSNLTVNFHSNSFYYAALFCKTRL